MANIDVESEVAGKVWEIVAKPNSPVVREDTILVIESMKMEIEVLAPLAGQVSEVLVAEGDDVTEGQVVARIEGAT